MSLLLHIDLCRVEILGWTLIHFCWQGAVIAIALYLALRLLQHRSANARYLAATAALGVMALSPVVTWMVLDLRIEHTRPLNIVTAVHRTEMQSVRPVQMPGLRPSTAMQMLPPLLVAVWLAGVALFSTRLVGGWLRVQKWMRHTSEPIEGYLQARCAELARRMGIECVVELRESMAVQVPTVAGWLKAVILFPMSALAGLPPQQLEALLAHELAHVRRHDYLVNLAQTVIETLLFYHPGVWWVSRRIRIEREYCCDDLVVQVLGDRLGYARALTALEEMRDISLTPTLAAGGGDLLARVRRILGLPSEQAGPTPTVLICCFALLLFLPLGACLIFHIARIEPSASDGRRIKFEEVALYRQITRPVPAIFGHSSSAAIGPNDGDAQPSARPASYFDMEIPTGLSRRSLVPSSFMRGSMISVDPLHDAGHVFWRYNANVNIHQFERRREKVQAQMEAISRRLEDEHIPLDQHMKMVARLSTLGEELGRLDAQRGEELGRLDAQRDEKLARLEEQRAMELTSQALDKADKEMNRAWDKANIDVQRSLHFAMHENETPDPSDSDD